MLKAPGSKEYLSSKVRVLKASPLWPCDLEHWGRCHSFSSTSDLHKATHNTTSALMDETVHARPATGFKASKPHRNPQTRLGVATSPCVSEALFDLPKAVSKEHLWSIYRSVIAWWEGYPRGGKPKTKVVGSPAR